MVRKVLTIMLIVTDDARAPVVVGVNVTLIVQEEPVAREVPQLLVWAKSPVLPPEMAMPLIDSCASSLRAFGRTKKAENPSTAELLRKPRKMRLTTFLPRTGPVIWTPARLEHLV